MQFEQLNLYISGDISFKSKFFILMNLIISNKENSIYYYFALLLFYELQNLSIFFTNKVQVLNEKYLPDKLLLIFEDLLRFKSLFFDHWEIYKIIIYCITIYIILFSLFFFFSIYNVNINTVYNRTLKILNYLINFNLFIFQNIF